MENVEDGGISKGPAIINICQKMKNRSRKLVTFHFVDFFILNNEYIIRPMKNSTGWTKW